MTLACWIILAWAAGLLLARTAYTLGRDAERRRTWAQHQLCRAYTGTHWEVVSWRDASGYPVWTLRGLN